MTHETNKDHDGLTKSTFQVGDFLVDPLALTVSRAGKTHHLQRVPMETLLLLARRAGQVVTREEVYKAVWDKKVVGDDGITQAISRLRKVFCDDRLTPSYIDTVHGTGYRLVAAVRPGTRTVSLTRRSVLGLAGASAVAAGLWALFTFDGSGAVSSRMLDARDTSIVLTFDNAGDSVDVAPTVAEVLIEQMIQSPVLNFVDESHMLVVKARLFGPADEKIDLARGLEIAQHEGAGALIHTTLEQSGDQFIIRSEIVDPESGDQVLALEQSATSPMALLDVVHDQSKSLRLFLGEQAETIRQFSMPPSESMSSNFKSIDLLGKARKARRRYDAKLALSFCDDAIAADPENAAAFLLRGRLHYGSHRRRAQAQEDWQSALDLVHKLSPRERLHLLALRSYFQTPDQMKDAWSKLRDSFPHMSRAHYELGNVEWYYFNDFVGAIKAYGRGLDVLTGDWVNTYHLAYVDLGAGEVGKAIAGFERSAEQLGHPYNFGVVDALVVARRYDDAYDVMYPNGLRARRLYTPHKKLIGYHLDLGHTSAARDEVGLFSADKDDPSWGRIAISVPTMAISRLGDSPEQWRKTVRREVQRMVDQLYASPPEGDLIAFAPLAIAAKYAVRAGEIDLAQKIVAWVKAQPDYVAGLGTAWYLGLAEAELRRAQGDHDGARLMLLGLVEQKGIMQAVESLAYLQSSVGNVKEAARHYQWIVDHRGQAFGEALFSFGRSDNIAIWAEAVVRLGELRQHESDASAALGLWQGMLDQWQDADEGHYLKSQVVQAMKSQDTSL